MHLFVQSVKKYTVSKIMLKDESRLYWDEVLSEKAKGLTVRKINQCTSICVQNVCPP